VEDASSEKPTSSKDNTPSEKSPPRRTTVPAGFDAWYAVYPKHVAKGPASKAYSKAVAEITKSKQLDVEAAEAWLLEITKQYAKAAPPPKSPPPTPTCSPKSGKPPPTDAPNRDQRTRNERFASTDPVSVEAVIAGLSRFRHGFHRHEVGGERELAVRARV